jgi:glycosyltransferase involved in cell wall biosynthesis
MRTSPIIPAPRAPVKLPRRDESVPGPQVRVEAPRLSVVVPTYNEAKNLPHVFSLLPADLHEVIVVDGHSVDGTVEVARRLRPDVRIVLQNRRGKGNAMACGFAAVTGDIVVMLDADGSADPREIPAFVSALVAGADFAKGTRFANGGGSADITRTRAWGNRWLNRAANLLFGTRYTDLCYGYNAFWVHCLPPLALDASGDERDAKLWGDGFEIETIINTRVAKARLRITEVASFESDRIFGESHLNTCRDGIRVLCALLVERVNGVGKRTVKRHRGPLVEFPGLLRHGRTKVPVHEQLSETVVARTA